MLHERPSASRILGGAAITAGLVVFGFESLMTFFIFEKQTLRQSGFLALQQDLDRGIERLALSAR